MVKRKADISLDEWLERRATTPETNHTTAVAATEGPVSANGPPAEEVPQTVTAEPVATAGVDPIDQEDGVVEWFWALLELSGYERW